MLATSYATMVEGPLAEFDGIVLDGLAFCARAYALFERLRAPPDGPDRLRLRASNVEKKLIEELLPICRYVQFYYRPGRYISVCWIAGNQTFDAKLYQKGSLIDLGFYPETAFLEVTGAMHKNEHWIRKLLSEGRAAFAPEGITKRKGKPVESKPVIFSNSKHVERFVPIVLEQLEKKIGNSYPADTSLVVECSLNRLYTPNEWTLLANEVKQQLPAHNFREILLIDGTYQCATPLT